MPAFDTLRESTQHREIAELRREISDLRQEISGLNRTVSDLGFKIFDLRTELELAKPGGSAWRAEMWHIGMHVLAWICIVASILVNLLV